MGRGLVGSERQHRVRQEMTSCFQSSLDAPLGVFPLVPTFSLCCNVLLFFQTYSGNVYFHDTAAMNLQSNTSEKPPRLSVKAF